MGWSKFIFGGGGGGGGIMVRLRLRSFCSRKYSKVVKTLYLLSFFLSFFVVVLLLLLLFFFFFSCSSFSFFFFFFLQVLLLLLLILLLLFFLVCLFVLCVCLFSQEVLYILIYFWRLAISLLQPDRWCTWTHTHIYEHASHKTPIFLQTSNTFWWWLNRKKTPV